MLNEHNTVFVQSGPLYATGVSLGPPESSRVECAVLVTSRLSLEAVAVCTPREGCYDNSLLLVKKIKVKNSHKTELKVSRWTSTPQRRSGMPSPH